MAPFNEPFRVEPQIDNTADEIDELEAFKGWLPANHDYGISDEDTGDTGQISIESLKEFIQSTLIIVEAKKKRKKRKKKKKRSTLRGTLPGYWYAGHISTTSDLGDGFGSGDGGSGDGGA